MDEPQERHTAGQQVGTDPWARSNRRLVFGISGGRPLSRAIFGVVVIALGVLFTLDNLGLVRADEILRWWPAALLAYGLARLTGFACRPNTAAGVMFSLIGGWMLLHNLHVLRYGLWDVWPLALVIVGVSMVTGALSRGGGGEGGRDASNTLNAFALWSGTQRSVVSQDFRGGEVTAIMGGHEIDLRSAKTAPEGAVIDLVVWWGGVVLRVPEDWAVSSDAIPLMAGIDDHSKPPAGEAKSRLTLRGVIVMGGVEVKN